MAYMRSLVITATGAIFFKVTVSTSSGAVLKSIACTCLASKRTSWNNCSGILNESIAKWFKPAIECYIVLQYSLQWGGQVLISNGILKKITMNVNDITKLSLYHVCSYGSKRIMSQALNARSHRTSKDPAHSEIRRKRVTNGVSGWISGLSCKVFVARSFRIF